jgi:hypothetical protein
MPPTLDTHNLCIGEQVKRTMRESEACRVADGNERDSEPELTSVSQQDPETIACCSDVTHVTLFKIK